jgi:hypothetical protein
VGPTPGWGLAQTGCRDPGGRGSGGMAKGRIFWRGVFGMAEGWVSCHVWDWNRAVAWHSPRDGEPGRTEQWLCRPMGQRFSKPAVLLLDRGVEKPSMI